MLYRGSPVLCACKAGHIPTVRQEKTKTNIQVVTTHYAYVQ